MNESAKEKTRDPIAIIGIGCRFPGGINSPNDFWHLMENCVDAITEVPKNRFDINNFYHPEPGTPGRIISKRGGFIEGIDTFDSHYFGISPREAESLDPQQRLLLEVAVEALEDGGLPLDSLSESKTGVFIGLWNCDYENIMYSATSNIDLYMTTGGGRYSAAGRISYILNLQGPSFTLDTACSSSLSAVHLACQSLRIGESNLALAGGVNLILQPFISIAYSNAGLLSPEGRCKFGDSKANGYVRSEGCGVVVLKKLQNALADHDPIYALIIGSATNHDGNEGLFVAPNQKAQEKLIFQAYQNARISPSHVDYIEAHGTGTAVGDPVELKALAKVLSDGRDKEKPCFVGSIKTNIGHTEAASGVAGLIKSALCLKHRRIPKSLHYDTPNPKIPWEAIPLRIQDKKSVPFSNPSRPLIAGVNSFGVSGTNVHVVMQEAPKEHNSDQHSAYQQDVNSAPIMILPLSACSSNALIDLQKSFRNYLKQDSDASLSDICYTAGVRRTHYNHRFAIIGENKSRLIEQLEAIIYNETPLDIKIGNDVHHSPEKLAFVFSGQGPQWFAMGRQLFSQERIYRKTIEKCDNILKKYASWSLLEELQKDETSSNMDQTEYAQPAIFALQIGLANIWRSWGIEPDGIVGHSIGEVAAACFAGVLDLEEAVRVVFHRGRLLQKATGQGKMAAVDVPVETAEKLIKAYDGRLSVAAINSPSSVTLSGEQASLIEILKSFEKKKIFSRMLKVNYAFHSPTIEPFRQEMESSVAGISPKRAKIPIASTVTGQFAQNDSYGPKYWAKNIRYPVQFKSAIDRLIEKGSRTFLEIGPHPVLLSSISQTLEASGHKGNIFASLQRGRNDRAKMLETVGSLYAEGRTVSWKNVNRETGHCIPLPHYAWQKKRYWVPNLSGPAKNNSPFFKSDVSVLPVQDGSTGVNEHRYAMTWKPINFSEKMIGKNADNFLKWIIFSDPDGIGEELIRCFRAMGHDCIAVEFSDHFHAFGGNRFAIVLDNYDDYIRLLKEAVPDGAAPVYGIIHTGHTQSHLTPTVDPEELTNASLLNTFSLLCLAKAASEIKCKTLPVVWLITKGAQAVSPLSSAPSVSQSPLWGLGRVLSLELPKIWGGMIDLDPMMSMYSNADYLCRILLDSDGEDQIAIREMKTFVARLTKDKAPETKHEEYQWRDDGAYWVTGGLGHLGLKVARWMADQGAKHLVLTSRRGLPQLVKSSSIQTQESQSENLSAIREIEALGTRVTVVPADVGDMEQMKVLVDRFGDSLPPLRGIIHAAGTISSIKSFGLDITDFASVFRSKVKGTWLLHRLTEKHDLDFFILFSSAAGVLGARDMAHYAAANHFLDIFSHYRKFQNLKAASINWGWWAGGWKDEKTTAYFQQAGMHLISDARGLKSLGEIISSNTTQSMFAEIDWSVFAPIYEAKKRRPLLDEIRANITEVDSVDTPTQFPLKSKLNEARPSERFEILQEHIRKLTAKLLGIKDPERIDSNAGFFQIGIDSFTAIELVIRLKRSLGLSLPKTVAFEYPNVTGLTTYIIGEMFEPISSPDEYKKRSDSAPEPEHTPAVQERNRLSEEELIVLISKKLKRNNNN